MKRFYVLLLLFVIQLFYGGDYVRVFVFVFYGGTGHILNRTEEFLRFPNVVMARMNRFNILYVEDFRQRFFSKRHTIHMCICISTVCEYIYILSKSYQQQTTIGIPSVYSN